MGNTTGISWCDATWNVARGCSKVNNDCLYCYMMRDGDRYGYDGDVVKRTKTVFNMPLNYKELKSKAHNGKPLIFTSSLTDVFHPQIDSFRNEVWDIIRKCPHLIFQVLTKRPERITDNLPKDWGNGWDNVWLGVSAGNQPNYNKMFSAFKNVKSKTKFLSLEPMNGEVLLRGTDNERNNWDEVFDWIIVGAESGFGTIANDPKVKWRYRECKLEWIENVVKECKSKDKPVFIKQLGNHLAKEMNLKDRTGSDINEFPNSLQLRQFPRAI